MLAIEILPNKDEDLLQLLRIWSFCCRSPQYGTLLRASDPLYYCQFIKILNLLAYDFKELVVHRYNCYGYW